MEVEKKKKLYAEEDISKLAVLKSNSDTVAMKVGCAAWTVLRIRIRTYTYLIWIRVLLQKLKEIIWFQHKKLIF